jgi:hypothetical protein
VIFTFAFESLKREADGVPVQMPGSCGMGLFTASSVYP